jgi:uncharacterized protein (DUF1015 family)
MTQPVRHPVNGARPLRLEPFRALRYNPDRVPDLSAVTCPPYDVIGTDRVGSFEAADPHNIVRLILPRAGDGEDRYAHAAQDLQRWVADRILIRDAEPALYVYELTDGANVAVGLVGGISLHDPAERRILPHEDVFPGPVADRTALMSATAAQFEPILLTYAGDGPASDVVDETLDTPPLLYVDTVDGASHRIWRISAPAALSRIGDDLADRQALIADGHHRYAAYLALRDAASTRRDVVSPGQLDAADGGESPPSEATGLAMLVDAHRHPLRLGAIHRSVSSLPWDEALKAARRGFGSVHVLEGPEAVDQQATALTQDSSEPRLAITDGQQIALLADADRKYLQESMPADRSSRWQQLAASIAHEFVLATLWGVSDADQRVTYHHQAADAVTRARRTGGTAILLGPARLADVLALAERDERMPRKSTSFGPKPRTGILMRLLS